MKLIILLTVFASITLNAAESPKLQDVNLKAGKINVIGRSQIIEMPSQLGPVLTITASQIQVSGGDKVGYALVFSIKEKGLHGRGDSSTVPYEEIDSLIEGIDYLQTVTKDSVKLDSLEANYSTSSDLEVSVFTEASSKLNSVVSIGKISPVRAYLTMEGLGKFKSHILEAKKKIDSIK